jgi:type I restriction enzyme S subunit
MSWQDSTLGALTKLDGGLIQTGPFGSQLHQAEYEAEGVPVVMPKDITDGGISSETVARVSEQTATRLERHKLKPRSIVLPRRGEITKRAFISDAQDGWLCGTGCLKIELNGDHLIPEYLYYFMEQEHVTKWLLQHAVGSTMLNLSAGIVAAMPVRYPAIKVQKAIAETLSTYDDLIDNNRRRMALLEDSARQLYREWFVRLRFPGHEHTPIVDGVPQGWHEAKVGSLILKGIKAKKIQKGEYVDNGTTPCIDQGSSFIGGYTNDDDARIVAPLPLIVFGDHTRVLKYVDFPFAIGADGTQLIAPNSNRLSVEYLFYALQSANISNHFYARHFKFLKEESVLIPTEPLMREFSSNSKAGFEQITLLRTQNQKLRQARDLLLPRLMNGELAV